MREEARGDSRQNFVFVTSWDERSAEAMRSFDDKSIHDQFFSGVRRKVFRRMTLGFQAFEDDDTAFVDSFEVERGRAIDDDEIIHVGVCDDGVFTSIEERISDFA